MRSFFFILAAVAVMGLAFWAYNENYKTQAVLDEVDALNAEIARLREAKAMLRAEWAYLNRPDRLRELTDLNFDRLSLLPLMPDQFGRIRQIAYPVALGGPILNPVDVVGQLPDAETP